MFAYINRKKIKRIKKDTSSIYESGWKLFLICEHPLLSQHNKVPVLSEDPKYDLKDRSSKGVKFISELCIKQNPVRVRYSSGVHVKENAIACGTGGASTASSSIFSEILYSPIFVAQFSCTDKVNAWDDSFLIFTKEVVFQPFT